MGVLKDPVGIARRGAEYYPLLGRPDHQIECARAASGESGGEMRLTFPVYTYTTDPLCAHAAAHGCQIAKFDPFLSLDCARVEGGGRNPRKGRDQILQRSVAEP